MSHDQDALPVDPTKASGSSLSRQATRFETTHALLLIDHLL
jgi:hypothetical protein